MQSLIEKKKSGRGSDQMQFQLQAHIHTVRQTYGGQKFGLPFPSTDSRRGKTCSGEIWTPDSRLLFTGFTGSHFCDFLDISTAAAAALDSAGERQDDQSGVRGAKVRGKMNKEPHIDRESDAKARSLTVTLFSVPSFTSVCLYAGGGREGRQID